MKLLAIGDFHGKFPEKLKKEAKNADLILCTGDFGGSDKLLKIIFKYFMGDWWEQIGDKKAKELTLEDYNTGKRIINELDALNKEIYIVPGNWDFEKRKKQRFASLKLKKTSQIIKSKKNLHFIQGKIRNIQGLTVYGFGGYIIPDVYLTQKGCKDNERRGIYQKEHGISRKKLFSKKIKNLDIFLSHYPPYNYFDIVKFKGENPMNGKHIGFKPYTDYIRKFKPKLFICGHMHEYQGKKKLGNTWIVATGSAKQGKAVIIDFDEKNKKINKIRFIK